MPIRKGPGLREESIQENFNQSKWKRLRWTFLILINFFFFASFFYDIQLLEGSLSSSRLLGFHLADPLAALQTMLASQIFNRNLIIGMITIAVFYLLFGGRSFCAWVCPYHLLAEWNLILKNFLLTKKILKFRTNKSFDRKIKFYLFGITLALSGATGFTIFEVINPVSALSRTFVYGGGFILIFVLFLLLFEMFYSKRAWCRYFCPVGVSYIALGRISPLKINWNVNKCTNCKSCQKICMVPFVLQDTVGKGIRAYVESGECTRCGLCIDACADGALQFKTKYLDKLL